MNRARNRPDRPAPVPRAHLLPEWAALLPVVLLSFSLPASWARQSPPTQGSSPQQTLIGALSAACRQDSQQFTPFLLADSRRSFTALPEEEQKTFLKRFSLTSLAGNPRALLDANGRMVVQCRTPAETVTFGLSPAQVEGNVAFISVVVNGGETTEFGLVRQPGGWRLFSLGLLVVNVPALVKQWQDAEMEANEQLAMSRLIDIGQAIKTYHTAFGQWPNTLAQLGPAPPTGVSPEHAQLLSKQVASGTADGYRFRYRIVTGPHGQIQGFELGAVPTQYGKTGRQSFFLDQQGKLHAADRQGAPATSGDPVVSPPSQPPS